MSIASGFAPGDRAILHVDMDAFYASVEILDDPTLRGRPVIVGGTPEGRGVVSAASYEARRFGVHSAMSAARARRLCPDGVFLRGRMERYAEVSRGIFAIFRDITPLVEKLSIDEAFLDVTGCRRLFGPPERIGREVKRRIGREIGLVASVGVAPNKFLAKLASDLEKPDGFTIILPGEAADRLAPLPVGRLWGVGKVLESRMHEAGIHHIGDLAARPEEELVSLFGDWARHLLALAVGHDERPVVPESSAHSVGNEMTFAADLDDPDELLQVLYGLTEKVSHRLRADGLVARTLTLKYRYPDFTTRTRAVSWDEPTASGVRLRGFAGRLFLDHVAPGGRPLRLIGVTASSLSAAAQVQPDLFPDPGREREGRIDDVLDRVRGRYGSKLRRGLK